MIKTVLQYDGSRPIVARSAGRGVISSINFALILAASSLLRQERQLHPEGDIGGGVDEYNRLLSGLGESESDDATRKEQGLGTGLTTMERGTLLKSLAAWINEKQLMPHASEVYFEISKVKAYNPFEVGDSVEQTLQRQLMRAPRELTTAQKTEAYALGLSEDAILASIQRQQAVNTAFLSDNRHYILDIVRGMECADMDDTSALAAFDKLPAMDRFRLYAAADSMMYRVALTQGQRWVVSKVQEGKDNLGILNAERLEFRKEINSFIADNKREISDAVASGATIPVLQPLPPTEAEIKRRMNGEHVVPAAK